MFPVQAANDRSHRSYEMRKTVLVLTVATLFLLTASGISSANDDDAVKNTGTRIESFLNQKGRLLIKDVYILGKVSGLYSSSGAITAIITYEPGDKENSLKGLLFEINEGQSDEKSHSSYLDIEEIEDLSAGIASIVRLAEAREKTENSFTEIVYTTRDNLSFGVYLGEAEKEAFITTGGPEKLTVFLEPGRMGEVKRIVDYGHTLLKMK